METKKKHKLFCIVQLPPPIHGVSMMNNYVVSSKLINEDFSIRIVDLKFVKSMEELEKFSFIKIYKALVYSIKIVKGIIHNKPDLVYFTIVPIGFGFYRDSFYVFLLKLLNQRIVFHLHGKGIQSKTGNFFLKKLYTWIFRDTYIICLSQKLTSDICAVYKSKPFIVPNGIKVLPDSKGKTLKKNNLVPNILCLSNYIKTKGILVLIEALSILKKNGYQFKASFVGAPYDLSIKELNSILTAENLTQCAKIVGPLHGDDKIEEFEKADVFVFPTFNEAFGLVNLEAMQYSLPVVSTFEGSIPDIVIDNETGLLAEPKNAQMLADKIAILLKDERLRYEMGKKGYDRFMSTYTLEHFEKNMSQTFQSILSAN